jgi:hypothetical protein
MNQKMERPGPVPAGTEAKTKANFVYSKNSKKNNENAMIFAKGAA